MRFFLKQIIISDTEWIRYNKVMIESHARSKMNRHKWSQSELHPLNGNIQSTQLEFFICTNENFSFHTITKFLSRNYLSDRSNSAWNREWVAHVNKILFIVAAKKCKYTCSSQIIDSDNFYCEFDWNNRQMYTRVYNNRSSLKSDTEIVPQ
jgi:hypothetical protein